MRRLLHRVRSRLDRPWTRDHRLGLGMIVTATPLIAEGATLNAAADELRVTVRPGLTWHDGEWFEIGRAEHDYMFEILPPLWMRGDMFALSEFMTGSITSVFFALSIAMFVVWRM